MNRVQPVSWVRKAIPTRWAPTSFKWSYNPYKGPYKWVTGVIAHINRVTYNWFSGPPCMRRLGSQRCVKNGFNTPKMKHVAHPTKTCQVQASQLYCTTRWAQKPDISRVSYNFIYRGYNPSYPFIRPFIGAP